MENEGIVRLGIFVETTLLLACWEYIAPGVSLNKDVRGAGCWQYLFCKIEILIVMATPLIYSSLDLI